MKQKDNPTKYITKSIVDDLPHTASSSSTDLGVLRSTLMPLKD